MLIRHTFLYDPTITGLRITDYVTIWILTDFYDFACFFNILCVLQSFCFDKMLF
jgi:hypothetical protein